MKAMYKGDGRYSKLGVTMDLLGIKDVSTTRQEKNGTIEWQLPIKYGKDRFIRVASFKTGYVRNQNGGYTNYQLNKRCESEPQYYELPNGTYNKYTTRTCKLIPSEIDRLEYLIAYCLKNYYIKNANQVAEGSYVSKWYHEYELERNQNKMEEICYLDANHEFVVNELQNKLANSVPKWKHKELEDRIYELESQVDVADDKLVNSKDYTTDLKAERNMLQGDLENMTEAKEYYRDKLHSAEVELSATKVRQDVSVIVNGHRYKVL